MSSLLWPTHSYSPTLAQASPSHCSPKYQPNHERRVQKSGHQVEGHSRIYPLDGRRREGCTHFIPCPPPDYYNNILLTSGLAFLGFVENAPIETDSQHIL